MATATQRAEPFDWVKRDFDEWIRRLRKAVQA